jgi:hypothetical protein
MKKTLFLIAILASAPLCSAQRTGAATANGNCNIVISGNNDTLPSATLLSNRCGLSKEQTDKIVKLLNAVFAKRDAAIMNGKLDELLEIANRPEIVINGPVQGNVAGVNNGQQVVNYEGHPVKVTTQFDVPQPETKAGEHPRTAAKFYTDFPWENGQFAIICDRPCHTDNNSVCGLEGYNRTSWGAFSGQPNVGVLMFGRQFPAGVICLTSVTSEDDTPVKITGVFTLTAPTTPPKDHQ